MVLRTAGPVAAVGEWTVLRGLRWPGRWFPSVLRVLVGPGGVFVIAVHPTTGEVTLGDDRLWVRGNPDEQAPADVADAALVVAQHAAPYAEHVQPVLCFTATPAPRGLAGGVLCTSAHELVGWLSRRPAALGAGQVDDVVKRLRLALRAEVDDDTTPATTGQHDAVVPRAPGDPATAAGSSGKPAVGLQSLVAAMSSFRQWIVGGGVTAKAVVLAAVTAAMLAYGPGALNPMGIVIGHWFSDATTPAACPAAGPAAGTASRLPGDAASAESSGEPARWDRFSRTDEAIRVAQTQLRAQWTPGSQTVTAAAHPLCRPDH
jgi:hypothetical protein